MNEQDRAFLKAHLSLLTDNDRKKLYKRAVHFRKLTQKTTKRRGPQLALDDDDAPITRTKIRPMSSSLDDIVVKMLRQDAEVASMATATAETATILTIHKGRCEVMHKGHKIECKLSPDLERAQQTEVAVGDLATISRREDLWFVDRVLPRRTKLSRPDPGHATRERVIVANVDAVVIVVSLNSPPLHPRLIDRYLIAVNRGGARPLIAVNKIDHL